VASAVWLVLTTVPAETARAVAVTGAGTGDLLWDSPVGQLARAAQRSWAELTVDLPKVLPRPWQFVRQPRTCRHSSRACLLPHTSGGERRLYYTRVPLCDSTVTHRTQGLRSGVQGARRGRVGAQGAWARAVWLWDRPKLKRLRLTISMAQWTVRLPALLALVASQARGGTRAAAACLL